jgi:hypothetical protein
MSDGRAKVENGAFTHPRRSSDICVQAGRELGGRDYAVSLVFDTIGRPRRRRIKRVFREAERAVAALGAGLTEEVDLAELDRRFREMMTGLNRFVRETGQAQPGFFGFCFAAAVRVDRELALHWMGDCRSYHFRPGSAGQDRPQVECITRDNNKLTSDILKIDAEKPGAEIELLKNEMLELSRQLQLYLGIGDDGDFAAQIENQTRRVDLEPGDMLMISTDGIFLPIIRYESAKYGFTLNRERLYLEEWLAQYLHNGEYLHDFSGLEVWRRLLEDLKRDCVEYTRRRRRYRDDMAVIYIS